MSEQKESTLSIISLLQTRLITSFLLLFIVTTNLTAAIPVSNQDTENYISISSKEILRNLKEHSSIMFGAVHDQLLSDLIQKEHLSNPLVQSFSRDLTKSLEEDLTRSTIINFAQAADHAVRNSKAFSLASPLYGKQGPSNAQIQALSGDLAKQLAVSWSTISQKEFDKWSKKSLALLLNRHQKVLSSFGNDPAQKNRKSSRRRHNTLDRRSPMSLPIAHLDIGALRPKPVTPNAHLHQISRNGDKQSWFRHVYSMGNMNSPKSYAKSHKGKTSLEAVDNDKATSDLSPGSASGSTQSLKDSSAKNANKGSGTEIGPLTPDKDEESEKSISRSSSKNDLAKSNSEGGDVQPSPYTITRMLMDSAKTVKAATDYVSDLATWVGGTSSKANPESRVALEQSTPKSSLTRIMETPKAVTQSIFKHATLGVLEAFETKVNPEKLQEMLAMSMVAVQQTIPEVGGQLKGALIDMAEAAGTKAGEGAGANAGKSFVKEAVSTVSDKTDVLAKSIMTLVKPILLLTIPLILAAIAVAVIVNLSNLHK